MSRQIGSLHRSISHPANLQNPIPIIPLLAFPPPESPHIYRSSGMDSDANSDITVFHTTSQFIKLDIETSDEFANSEPSPSTFSQLTFRPINSQSQIDPPSTISYLSQVTPTYSPFTNERSNNQKPRKSHLN